MTELIDFGGMDLVDFYDAYREHSGVAKLRAPQSVFIPGRGCVAPKVMVVTGIPTVLDNTKRKACSGTPGMILDGLLESAGLFLDSLSKPDSTRLANAFVTPAVKYRMSGPQSTLEATMDALKWIKEEHSVLGRPPVIVSIGAVANICMFGSKGMLGLGHPHPIAAMGPVIWPMKSLTDAQQNERLRPVIEGHWNNLGNWLKEEGLL